MIRNDLQHIPVFNNFAVLIKSKDVDACIILVPRPLLVTMQHNVVLLGYSAPERDLFIWKLGSHALRIVDKSLLSISHVRVMLGIRSTDLFLDGLPRTALVEHQVIEGFGI